MRKTNTMPHENHINDSSCHHIGAKNFVEYFGDMYHVCTKNYVYCRNKLCFNINNIMQEF